MKTEPSKVFDFYDMVCTMDCEECEGTGGEPLCEETIEKVQAEDAFCIAMPALITSQGTKYC